ncbi:hypothetical protein FE257_005420 [Aspergillus nanangensis]|uniref:Uncharacterized protein n=1 Tax=Aspergillus nanangensis TaxID=2582783 RepID=A0AAD4GUP8_ASPNN|nr:hypothetical protein FE257_005420 [Aspergillus nanangensis]
MNTYTETTSLRVEDSIPQNPSTSFFSISDSLTSAPPVDHKGDYDPTVGAKPYSPFYRHATPNVNLDNLDGKTIEVKDLGASREDSLNDVEQGLVQPSDDSKDNRRQSKLWKEKKRRCDCMRSMTKKQRIATKAAIATVILGSMVAIALGITAAVDGGIWSSPDHQQEFTG